MVLSITNGDRRQEHRIKFDLEAMQNIRLPRGSIEDVFPWLIRHSSSLWVDTRTGEKLTFEAILAAYWQDLPAHLLNFTDALPDWLIQLRKEFNVYFIQTQRLLRLVSDTEDRRGQRQIHRATVTQYAEDLMSRLREQLTLYSDRAQSLDRTFPNRVLESPLPQEVTTEKIRDIYQEQQTKRKRLVDAGLIPAEVPLPLPNRELDSTDRRLLWTYLADIDEKLAVFDPMLRKIELLQDIICSRFRHKNFRISRDAGFVLTDHLDNLIPLEGLSSGEQHELVLAYDLIFKTRRDSMILIDEPELSLHVTWQHKFLEDLQRISLLSSLDFLVATHSPQIIHNRWELAVALEGDD